MRNREPIGSEIRTGGCDNRWASGWAGGWAHSEVDDVSIPGCALHLVDAHDRREDRRLVLAHESGGIRAGQVARGKRASVEHAPEELLVRARLPIACPRDRREALHAWLPRAVDGEVARVRLVLPVLVLLRPVPEQVGEPRGLALVIPPEILLVWSLSGLIRGTKCTHIGGSISM